MKSRFLLHAALAGTAAILLASPASASLMPFQTYVGTYGVSTDGCGSTTQSCNIRANAPAGATVVAAYLYSSMYFSTAQPGGTLNGSAVDYATPLGITSSCCTLQAWRADVTSIVAAVINGGAGGIYNFGITETDAAQDGEALVVVYSDASLPTQTVGILDGFSATTGDTTAINFSDPLHPADPGFTAQMMIADGFSYDGDGCLGSGQSSMITVNGIVVTNSAGCNDDNKDAGSSNGNLITVGSFDDSFSASLPSVADDHERYDLTAQIMDGDTSIIIDTLNPSNDDNIFMATFLVTGAAGINEPPPGVPEPLTLSLFGAGLAGAAALRRRRNAKK